MYRVEPICRILPIAPFTYHAHVASRVEPTRKSAQAWCDDALGSEVRRVSDENFRASGVGKAWQQLRWEGVNVAHCTVARLIQAMGLVGMTFGEPVRTTNSDGAAPGLLDPIIRQFRAASPNASHIVGITKLWSIVDPTSLGQRCVTVLTRV